MIPGRRTSEGQLVVTAGPPLSTDPRMAGFALKPTGEIYASGGQSAFTPEDLFLNGEQGAWYDPSDLTTMFQDRAGTTPVTADGQTVGLILDKSKGLALGVEQIANNNLTDWTTTGSATINSVTQFTLSGNGLANRVTSPMFTEYATNSQQKAVVTLKANKSCSIKASNLWANSLAINLTTSFQTFSIDIGWEVLSYTDFLAFFTEADSPVVIDVQSISAKFVLGNHATAPSDAARPLYKTDGTYHWLQFDGVDDSMSTAAIDFTATYKMSAFAGANTTGTPGIFGSFFGNGPANATGTAGKFGISLPSSSGANCRFDFGGVSAVNNNAVTITLNSKQVFSQLLSSNSAPYQLCRTNGVLGATGDNDVGGQPFANATFGFGDPAFNSGATFFVGNIYSLIVRGALSTTQEITDTETWVNGKTGAY